MSSRFYLGPRERVLEQLRTQGSVAPQQGAAPPLRTVQTREFGASTLFYALAQDLGLIDLINAHVPPAPARRRTSLSVGHYLVLAAINRTIWPKSKRAFAEWYEGTVLARLVPAAAEELSSQRFWDHMHLFEAHHFAPIQRELLTRIRERFPLGEQFFVYDTTNYYTFIHTFNSRPSLPQRGRNKQKRHDLRQLSLALVVDEERGLPLYYRCYEGNVTDVVALGASLSGMICQGLPPQAPARLTLVLDKGNVSFDNFKALHKAQFSFLAAVPAGWVRSLFQVALRAYQPLALARGKRVKVYAQSDTRLGGIDGKLLVSFSPTFYRKQVRTLDLLQQKADQQLHALRASIQDAVVRKRPRTGRRRPARDEPVGPTRPAQRLLLLPRCTSTTGRSTTSSGSGIGGKNARSSTATWARPSSLRTARSSAITAWSWPTGIRPRWKTCSASARVGGRGCGGPRITGRTVNSRSMPSTAF